MLFLKREKSSKYHTQTFVTHLVQLVTRNIVFHAARFIKESTVGTSCDAHSGQWALLSAPERPQRYCLVCVIVVRVPMPLPLPLLHTLRCGHDWLEEEAGGQHSQVSLSSTLSMLYHCWPRPLNGSQGFRFSPRDPLSFHLVAQSSYPELRLFRLPMRQC